MGNKQDGEELEMGIVRCEHKQIEVRVKREAEPSQASVKPLCTLRASELAVTSQELGYFVTTE